MRSARILPSLSSASAHLVQLVAAGRRAAANSSLRSARHFTGRFSTLADPHRDRFVGLDAGPHAEAAADVAHQHAHLVLAAS